MTRNLIKLITAFLFVLILISCTSKKENEKEEATKNKFVVADSLMQNMTIDTVTLRQIYTEYHFTGTVTYDQDKVVKIFPLVSGLVTEVKVSLGDLVQKDQVIAVVRSSEMAGVQNDLVTAQSNLAVSEKNLAATTDMYKSGITSEKEYIAAQKEHDKAKSELKRIQTVKSIYGNGKQSDYIIKSPISGFVVEKLINPNMQLRPDNSNNLFTISDLKKVWVVAKIYESDIAKIKPDMEVKINTLAYPDKEFTGKIDKIFNVLDPDSKTMTVKIKLDNPDYTLKPEMFANVKIIYNTSNDKLPVVDSKALVFNNKKYFVMVLKGKKDFEVREVKIGETVGNKTYILSGLQAGERVASKYSLLLYNALTSE